MSDTLRNIQILYAAGKVRVSDHAYDELAEDLMLAEEVLASLGGAIVVEDYPTDTRGPSVLVLQQDAHGSPIHALWGIPSKAREPAVLITVYRPDPRRWDESFMRRK